MDITNEEGNITTIYDRDAFVNVLSGSPSGYHLNTKEFFPSIRLYYFFYRWYEPKIGLFTQRDPKRSNKEPFSFYLYVYQNSTFGYDPTGAQIGTPWYSQCRECAQRIYNMVMRWARRPDSEFGGGEGAGSFVRHCVASCMVSDQCGSFCALTTEWYNEFSGSLSWEDVADNSAGRECALGKEDCFNCCRIKRCERSQDFGGGNPGYIGFY